VVLPLAEDSLEEVEVDEVVEVVGKRFTLLQIYGNILGTKFFDR